jgi:putative two-component system response regulator
MTPTDIKNIDLSKHTVLAVDDIPMNLLLISKILSRLNITISTAANGREALDFIAKNKPSLVLLDLMMPEMDGFETMEQIRQSSGPDRDVPVIFLTADESMEAETRALKLGALDFLKKPFSPEIMTLRVRHTLELVHLQEHLTATVERKTQENEKLSLHVVQTLAEAIDAKDRYTKGHSGRVAEYAKEIGKRIGYTWGQQNEIYMLGLLHDVGKIGIPDAIINKPGKLTPEEYDIIKTHSTTGAKILMKIEEMPRLMEAARWHHERYDGHGYPDGLRGEEIPEHSRIIAVADAYDAMSSDRSYRKMLPQDKVKDEIEKGKGTQFDPAFADIMLDIIAEDKEYRKRGTETA